MTKAQVDRIEGIPPAIAIDQTNPVRTSRSTSDDDRAERSPQAVVPRAARLLLAAAAADPCAAIRDSIAANCVREAVATGDPR